MGCNKIREETTKRLNRIAGQVNGLKRMIEQGRYCIDILTQFKAVERALHSVGEMILDNHLKTCVTEAFKSNDAQDSEEKIAELMKVFSGMRAK
ncbi:MAG: metal-sensitive transcriptional regulator [Planctomycetes bacterium]|nr:metal-sensitive transcriptional regulator [Planctomycetota bacterium]